MERNRENKCVCLSSMRYEHVQRDVSLQQSEF